MLKCTFKNLISQAQGYVNKLQVAIILKFRLHRNLCLTVFVTFSLHNFNKPLIQKHPRQESCFHGGIIKVLPTFALLTLIQAASHCSGFMIRYQMPLYKVKKTLTKPQNPTNTKHLTKNPRFFIDKIGDTRFCSVLTNLFRKL